jgi:hypothetical protein
MSPDSCRDSFKTGKPKLIRKDHCCHTANGSKMDSLGVFEVPLTIPGQKFVHPVAFMEDLIDNIVGIAFMHANKVNYDTISKQITFAHLLTNALYAIK